MPQIKDVFKVDKVVAEHGNKILLLGGVGSGKSSFVTEILAKKGSVLFITSRKAKVLEDTKCSCFSEVFKWYTNDNQTLITNAKLARLIERISDDFMQDLDEFIAHFDYIVVDEVHSIATDSAYAESCASLLSFIEYATDKGKTVICMTGTPEPIQTYFDENGWYTVDYMKTCDYVHPKEIALIKERNVLSHIQKYKDSHKIIYFSNHTDTIAKCCKELIDKKILLPIEIAVAVSKSKEKSFYENLKSVIQSENDFNGIKSSSEEAYEHIISKKLLPPDCKILFSTSVLKEGINIKNEEVIMFCENHVLSNLIQFFGRARQGAKRVFVVEDSSDHQIKHNRLLYDYAVTAEVEAANAFYKDSVNVEHNFLSIIEREQLSKHVTKNPYIYYDYIRSEFKVFHVRYREEQRLIKNHNWCKKIVAHCEEYGIKHLWFDDGEAVRNVLNDLIEKRAKFWVNNKLSPNIKKLKDLLNTAYKITYGQPKRINEQLEGKKAPIRIKTGKENGKENRNKQYWQLVSIDEFEAKKVHTKCENF